MLWHIVEFLAVLFVLSLILGPLVGRFIRRGGLCLALVVLVASSVPARASQSCPTIAEARAALPNSHLWWHGRGHCWDANPGRAAKLPQPPSAPTQPPRPSKDNARLTILYPALLPASFADPEMIIGVAMTTWPLMLDIDETTSAEASADYCCWPPLDEPDFDERWQDAITALSATRKVVQSDP